MGRLNCYTQPSQIASKVHFVKRNNIFLSPSGIKMDFHQKPGKMCDALATDTSVYSIMWSWKLGKTRKSYETRKILIPGHVSTSNTIQTKMCSFLLLAGMFPGLRMCDEIPKLVR